MVTSVQLKDLGHKQVSVGAEVLERTLVSGDLKDLTAAQRVQYYAAVCASIGLNPLTRPFEYITLNGKLTLYAKRDATDQLRKLHNVSVTKLQREKVEDVYVVTATAVDSRGRSDEAIGAVSLVGLKGEAFANALMKAETKAKRRVTLSIVGLGWLDETEVETVPSAQAVVVDQETGEIAGEKPTERARTRREVLATRYATLVDEADSLLVPAASYDPKWSEDELVEHARELKGAIAAKKAQG